MDRLENRIHYLVDLSKINRKAATKHKFPVVEEIVNSFKTLLKI